MPTAQNTAETDAAERPSLAKRILALPVRLVGAARSRPLLFAVISCGTLIIMGSGASVIYYLTTHRPDSDRRITVNAALALLDAEEYDKAERMAIRLGTKLKGDYHRMGHPLFVQGAALAHEADRPGHESERRTLYLVAAHYLEEAQARGFPPGREKEGTYLLATSLFNAGHYAASLPVLHNALEKMPGQQYELAHLLSRAYLLDTVPDFEKAEKYTRLWLEDPALTEDERDEAELQLAEICYRQGYKESSRQALSLVEADSPTHHQALLLEAQLQIQEGDELVTQLSLNGESTKEGEDEYRDAIGTLERAQSKDIIGTTTRQARYLIGECYRKLGDRPAAQVAFERTRHLYYRTPESLAATLSEAEIAQDEGRGSEARELYEKALNEAGNTATYRNRWVPLNQLKGRLKVALKKYADSQEFETALKLAESFNSVMADDESTLAKAEAHVAWAENLLLEASQQPSGASDETKAAARHQFRLAGDQYRKLAELRFATPNYPDDLWKSGNCFLRGQNYELAKRLIREHLNNVPRKQAATGLVGMGECHLALGNYNTAIDVLSECINFFPKHPESYRARLLASHAYREHAANIKDSTDPKELKKATKRLAEAQRLLIDNIHNSSLTPQSKQWQQSLLAYGTLLYLDALIHETESWYLMKNAPDGEKEVGLAKLKEAHDLFRQAISTLEETVEREENSASEEGREPDVSEARYFIAEASRHAANLPQRSLSIEPTTARRNALRQQMRDYLRESAEAHRKLQEQLAQKRTITELSRIEERVLRNTYFAYADALFSLEQYDQAIEAYLEATNRYQNEPEALEALMQIANCYRNLNQPFEARGTLLQAKSVLARIRADADYTKTTRYSQKQWENLIGWLSTL